MTANNDPAGKKSREASDAEKAPAHEASEKLRENGGKPSEAQSEQEAVKKTINSKEPAAEPPAEQLPEEKPEDTKEQTAETLVAAPAHPWEAELEEYPLRQSEEDPKWAVRIVQTWLSVALFSVAFVLALLILGFFFD